jgi:hypothetical protein
LGEAPTLGMMRQKLLELVRHQGEMLVDIRTSLDHIEGRFDSARIGLRGLEHGVDRLSRNIDHFRCNLRRAVKKAVREAFREERQRKR